MIQNGKYRVLTATNSLIVIQTAAYILDKYLLDWSGGLFQDPGIWDRLLGFCGGDVYMALCYYDGCLAEGELWRGISFLFVHLFLLHLVVNMAAFYIVGNRVERKYGPIFTVAAFLVIGVLNLFATNALPFLETAGTATGGASGAVFGFMGIAAAQWLRDRSVRREYSKAQRILLAIYGVLFTYFMGDWTLCCHNIGFAMGFLPELIHLKIRKKCIHTGA